MNKKESIPLFKVNNSKELRFILPFAPFGVMIAIFLNVLLYYIGVQINIKLLYLLSFAAGIFFSEILYFYRKDEYFYFNTKVEILRGGKVKNIIIYSDIKEIRYSNDFTLGGGPGGARFSYLELELNNGEFERLLFSGFFQKKNMNKSLKIMENFGVKIIR